MLFITPPYLKALMPITFSSPRVKLEVVPFLVSNEIPYFSHFNPKISASSSLYFGNYSRKCTYFRCIKFYFLMYFHTASSPVSFTCFTPGEKTKSKLDVKLCKMFRRGQGQLVQSGNCTCQNGHNPM